VARPRAWGDNLIDIAMTGETQQSPVDLLSELVTSDTITVIRLVGHLSVVPNSITASTVMTCAVDLGIGVASIEAFNVAGGIPDPNAAGDVPIRNWLWRDRLVAVIENAGGTEDSYKQWPEVRFDLRAMRKVDRGRLYLTVVPTALVGTYGALRLVGIIRALCLT